MAHTSKLLSSLFDLTKPATEDLPHEVALRKRMAEPALDWHAEQADALGKAGDHFAAAFHRRELARHQPYYFAAQFAYRFALSKLTPEARKLPTFSQPVRVQ